MGLGDKIENAGQDASGRLKEAAGAVTGNEDLKAEGKLDQVAASAKDAVEDVKDKIGEGIDALKDKFSKD